METAGIAKYQYLIPPGVSTENQINMMGRGIFFSDIINTVSETYAQEILTPEYGEGFDWLLKERRDSLYGILNGVDYEINDPATDPRIYQHYDLHNPSPKLQNKIALQRDAGLAPEAEIPLIGIISRLSDQKGFDLIGQVIEGMMENLNFQLILLGTGMEYYHHLFNDIKQKYPQKAAIYLTFNNELAQRIYAGSDLFLMPSRFEPCGSGQLLSMRYGSIPVVRETGGLKDTITDFDQRTGAGNGFTFKNYNALAMYTAIVRAIETYHYKDQWRMLMQRGMSADFSWKNSAQKYVELYWKALTHRKEYQKINEYANMPG